MATVKIATLGDSGIGKKWLLLRWLKAKSFDRANDGKGVFLCEDGTSVSYQVSLYNEKQLRPFRLQEDIILLCFAINEPDTFARLKTFWLPYAVLSEKPIFLVGLRADCRDKVEHSGGRGLTSEAEEKEFAYSSKIITHYFEVSARTGIVCDTLLGMAIGASLDYQESHNDMDAWLSQRAQTKHKVPSPIHGLLTQYAQGKRDEAEASTFVYIILFFATGEENPRLKVASADYGYTLEELKTLKGQGKTAREVAGEIVSRGVDEED
jgi:GTPase SAR1 family protein